MINNSFLLNTKRKTELSRYVYILKSVTATESVIAVSKDWGATYQEKTISYAEFSRDGLSFTTCESGQYVMLVLRNDALGSLIVYSRDHGTTFQTATTTLAVWNVQLFNDRLAAFYVNTGSAWQIRLTKDYSLQTYTHQIADGYMLNRASKDELFIQLSSNKYLFNVYTHVQTEITLPVNRYCKAGSSHFCFNKNSNNRIYRKANGVPDVNDYTDIALMVAVYALAVMENGYTSYVAGHQGGASYEFAQLQVNGAYNEPGTIHTYVVGNGFYQLGKKISDINFNAIGCGGVNCVKVEPNNTVTVLTTGLLLAVNANYTND